MNSVKAFLVVLVSLVTACSNNDSVRYLDDHPEFSPIVKRDAKYEYQIVWSRSWRPTIYLKAYVEQDHWGKHRQAFVSYASSEGSVPRLATYKISTNEWQSIVKAVDESILWSYKSECDQLAYKTRSIFFDDDENDGCVEIIMTDGAAISIAISEPERQLGIYRACNDLGPCEPFGSIARAILKTIGREHEAS